MAILFEGLLPSGRAVRFSKLTTEQYFECQERAASAAGDPKRDPLGVRLKQAVAVEMVKTSLRFVTQPLAWRFEPVRDKDGNPRLAADGKTPLLSEVVDVDAMLGAVDEKAWLAVDALTLGMADSPLSFNVLFGEIADFGQMARLIQETLEPARAASVLSGKARRISV